MHGSSPARITASPTSFSLVNRTVFGLAAVWDRSVAEDDDVIESCTIIRVPANDLLTEIAPSDAACRPS